MSLLSSVGDAHDSHDDPFAARILSEVPLTAHLVDAFVFAWTHDTFVCRAHLGPPLTPPPSRWLFFVADKHGSPCFTPVKKPLKTYPSTCIEELLCPSCLQEHVPVLRSNLPDKYAPSAAILSIWDDFLNDFEPEEVTQKNALSDSKSVLRYEDVAMAACKINTLSVGDNVRGSEVFQSCSGFLNSV